MKRDEQKIWQPGLKSQECILGEEGAEGSQFVQIFEGRDGDLETIETLVENRLPDVIILNYDTHGVHHEVKHSFAETVDGTRWVSDNVFRFRGVMKPMSFFMKKAFRENSRLSMERFGIFVQEKKKS